MVSDSKHIVPIFKAFSRYLSRNVCTNSKLTTDFWNLQSHLNYFNAYIHKTSTSINKAHNSVANTSSINKTTHLE